MTRMMDRELEREKEDRKTGEAGTRLFAGEGGAGAAC